MYKRLFKSIVKKHIRRGDLTITFADGARWRVGDGEAPHVEVALTDAGAVRAMIVRPELALGELYMDDRLRIGRGSEAAFRAGNLIVFQMQLMNEIDAVPLTRRYMYDERALEFAKLEPAA